MMDVDESDGPGLDPMETCGKRSRDEILDPMEAFKRIRIASQAESDGDARGASAAAGAAAAAPPASRALGRRAASLPLPPAPVVAPIGDDDAGDRDYERMNSYLGLLELERTHRRASLG